MWERFTEVEVINKKKVCTYEACDGVEFPTKEMCEDYETALKDERRGAFTAATLRLIARSTFVGHGESFTHIAEGNCDDEIYIVTITDESVLKDINLVDGYYLRREGDKHYPIGSQVLYIVYDKDSFVFDGTYEECLAKYESELKGAFAKCQK